ncbi:MAG TPA: hypothetical protein VF519_00380 [Mycobacteriales bacterium]
MRLSFAVPALALAALSCAPAAKPNATPTRTVPAQATEQPCPAPKATKPKWPKDVPDFIPRPDGVTIQKVSDASGGNVTQVRFVTPMSMFESRNFILGEFPRSGLRLGRGDSEPAELDVQFQRNEGLRGLIRVFGTTERCTTLWLLAVVRDTSAPYDIGYTPPPNATPLPFG